MFLLVMLAGWTSDDRWLIKNTTISSEAWVATDTPRALREMR